MAVRIAEPTYVFCSHEDVLSSDDTMQQLVVKITIPSSEREQVLKELQEFNIDHFTLFQTEDALVRALAMREFGA